MEDEPLNHKIRDSLGAKLLREQDAKEQIVTEIYQALSNHHQVSLKNDIKEMLTPIHKLLLDVYIDVHIQYHNPLLRDKLIAESFKHYLRRNERGFLLKVFTIVVIVEVVSRIIS